MSTIAPMSISDDPSV